MRVAIAAIGLRLAGCGGPSATVVPFVHTEVDFIKASCTGSTYVRCYESLKSAETLFAGSTVAICEYSDGEGDVVLVDDGETPEHACSRGGLISPSQVHGTVQFGGIVRP
jgi:hypothetical protein